MAQWNLYSAGIISKFPDRVKWAMSLGNTEAK